MATHVQSGPSKVIQIASQKIEQLCLLLRGKILPDFNGLLRMCSIDANLVILVLGIGWYCHYLVDLHVLDIHCVISPPLPPRLHQEIQ